MLWSNNYFILREIYHSRQEFTIHAINGKFSWHFDDKHYEAKYVEVVRLQIAICDDESNVRSYIRKLIEKQGGKHSIIEYDSGEKLLANVKDENGQSIDLLFLDIAMGDMDGMETARRLRQLQADKGQAAWGRSPVFRYLACLPPEKRQFRTLPG